MPEKPDQKSFILQVLASTGWTQTDLAKRAGLDPSTLSRFLSGSRDDQALRASTIRQIEKVVGLSMSGAALPPVHNALGMAEAEQLPIQRGGINEVLTTHLAADGRPVDAWTLKSRALELAGYQPGDTLFVRLGETALRGDVVCAQIYDWSLRKAETVFRIFDPPYLLSATTDSTLLRPLEINSENITIKGVVLHCLRSRG